MTVGDAAISFFGLLCCCGPCVLFFLLFAALIVLSLKAKGNYEKSLQQFASEIGCRYIKEGALKEPKVAGVYRGREISLEAHTEYHGSDSEDRYSVTYTRASARHSAGLKEEMGVLRRGPLTWGSGIAGIKSVSIEPAFDKEYMVTCRDEPAARSLFDVEIQHKMMGLSARLRRVFIQKESVLCEMPGHVSGKQNLRNLLDLAVDMAERLEKAV